MVMDCLLCVCVYSSAVALCVSERHLYWIDSRDKSFFNKGKHGLDCARLQHRFIHDAGSDTAFDENDMRPQNHRCIITKKLFT